MNTDKNSWLAYPISTRNSGFAAQGDIESSSVFIGA
jgi:hypothetical protein